MTQGSGGTPTWLPTGNLPPTEGHTMTIAITGVTGHFGRLVVESLLARDVPADQIVATGRDVSKIADLADRGVRTQASDYSHLDSLRQVLADADRLLLVSGSE